MPKITRVRPSEIVKREECGYQRHLFYDRKIESEATSCNLVFGSCVDDATGKYLEALYAGLDFDTEKHFEMLWQEALDTRIISYSSIWDAESLRETGKRLCGSFPAAWDDLNLMILSDEDGPLLHRRMVARIAPDIELSGEMDVVAMDMDGFAVIIDVKTPATSADEYFTLAADQLTAYDILLRSRLDKIGALGISQVGYLEGLKKKIPKSSRGTGPIWTKCLVPGRSEDARNEYIEKVKFEVAGIRSGYHPKRSRMAYNSPCALCDFKDYCLKGCTEGLVFPEDKAA